MLIGERIASAFCSQNNINYTLMTSEPESFGHVAVIETTDDFQHKKLAKSIRRIPGIHVSEICAMAGKGKGVITIQDEVEHDIANAVDELTQKLTTLWQRAFEYNLYCGELKEQAITYADTVCSFLHPDYLATLHQQEGEERNDRGDN